MQSSPPERAWKRSSSPAASQYSLDLAALDLDSRSGATTPVPEQYVDRVRSEEIDGPSDFTVNMEKWMRGGTAGRGTVRSLGKGLDTVGESHDEGMQANGSFLTPRKPQDEEQSASHHTPSDSPPIDSVFTTRSGRRRTGADVSEWDPYTDGDESTPEPPAHKQFLQPTVEDDHSGLTPARLPPMLQRTKSTSSRTQVAAEEHLAEEQERSSPGRPSSETLSPVRSPARSPVRSPVFQRPAPRHFSSQSTEAAFEKQMEDLQAKCKQLELFNAALGQAVDEERRMRAEDKAANDKRMEDAQRREQGLAEMRDQAYLQCDDYRKDVTELKSRIELHERGREQSREAQLLLRQQHNDDLRKTSEDAERRRAEQAASIRALEQDLELARRSRDEAEESERAMREELDRHHAELDGRQIELVNDHDDDLDRMQSDLTTIEDPEDRLHEFEEELRGAKSQIEKLSAAKRSAESETTDMRAELASLRRGQEEDTARITADHRRAVAVAEELQTQLRKLREQLHAQQAAPKAEVESVRAEAAKQSHVAPEADVKALRAELEARQIDLNTAVLDRDALADDLETQQSALNATILERDEVQDELKAAQSQLEEIKQTLVDREVVNADLDAKVSASIAKREAYWRGRMEASEKERKIMTKALLRQWGREEVGVVEAGRQGYEYQSLKRERTAGCIDVDAQGGA